MIDNVRKDSAIIPIYNPNELLIDKMRVLGNVKTNIQQVFPCETHHFITFSSKDL